MVERPGERQAVRIVPTSAHHTVRRGKVPDQRRNLRPTGGNGRTIDHHRGKAGLAGIGNGNHRRRNGSGGRRTTHDVDIRHVIEVIERKTEMTAGGNGENTLFVGDPCEMGGIRRITRGQAVSRCRVQCQKRRFPCKGFGLSGHTDGGMAEVEIVVVESEALPRVPSLGIDGIRPDLRAIGRNGVRLPEEDGRHTQVRRLHVDQPASDDGMDAVPAALAEHLHPVGGTEVSSDSDSPFRGPRPGNVPKTEQDVMLQKVFQAVIPRSGGRGVLVRQTQGGTRNAFRGMRTTRERDRRKAHRQHDKQPRQSPRPRTDSSSDTCGHRAGTHRTIAFHDRRSGRSLHLSHFTKAISNKALPNGELNKMFR